MSVMSEIMIGEYYNYSVLSKLLLFLKF